MKPRPRNLWLLLAALSLNLSLVACQGLRPGGSAPGPDAAPVGYQPPENQQAPTERDLGANIKAAFGRIGAAIGVRFTADEVALYLRYGKLFKSDEAREEELENLGAHEPK